MADTKQQRIRDALKTYLHYREEKTKLQARVNFLASEVQAAASALEKELRAAGIQFEDTDMSAVADVLVSLMESES